MPINNTRIDFNQYFELAITDHLWRMVSRSSAFAGEREDITQPLEVLSLEPTNPGVDHPLVDLYMTLHFLAMTNEMVGAEHIQLLADCVVLPSKLQMSR
jgi:hypothetical protein